MKRAIVVSIFLLSASLPLMAARVQVQPRSSGGGGGASNPPVAPSAPTTVSPTRTHVQPRTNAPANYSPSGRTRVIRSAHPRVPVPNYYGSGRHWARYHGGHYWWFDSGFHHWSYYWNGYWWWTAPSGVSYVYINNTYEPYAVGVVPVEPIGYELTPPPAPDETTTTSTAPTAMTAADTGNSWRSPDNKREVQTAGSNNDAFLYDISSGTAVYMTYLAGNVTNVRFSGGADGKPLRILVDFKDGKFGLYSDSGQSLDSTP